MQVNPHIGIFSEDAGAPTSPVRLPCSPCEHSTHRLTTAAFVGACVLFCCQAGRLQQRIISNVRARLFKYTIEKALPHEMQA